MVRSLLGTRGAVGLAALLLAGGVLTACSDDDSNANLDAAVDAPTGEESEDAAPAGDRAELTAEDGWLEVHDLDIPGPGQGELTIDGQTIDLEVECLEGMFSEADFVLFNFAVNATGVDADGRDIQVALERRIVSVEEAGATGGYGIQDYGDVTVTVLVDPETVNSSVLVSPSDDDPDGEMLPVVRVDESGAFTVVEDLPAMTGHDDALSGPIELAGQCQEAWPA